MGHFPLLEYCYYYYFSEEVVRLNLARSTSHALVGQISFVLIYLPTRTVHGERESKTYR